MPTEKSTATNTAGDHTTVISATSNVATTTLKVPEIANLTVSSTSKPTVEITYETTSTSVTTTEQEAETVNLTITTMTTGETTTNETTTVATTTIQGPEVANLTTTITTTIAWATANETTSTAIITTEFEPEPETTKQTTTTTAATMSTGESTTTETTSTAETTTEQEPEVTKTTVTTQTTTMSLQTSMFPSTEMPNEDRGKVPQGDQPRCEKLVKADIVFGLHGISSEDRKSVSEFIKAVGSGFDLATGNFKLGLKENCKRLELNPTEFGDIEDYRYAVQDVMEMELRPLLLHTKRAFTYSRRRADRIAILLISGKIFDMARAYRIANILKKKAKVIVIGVGVDFDTEQLKGLASYRDKTEPDISHVFPVVDSKNLLYIAKKLHKLLCVK